MPHHTCPQRQALGSESLGSRGQRENIIVVSLGRMGEEGQFKQFKID